MNEKIREFVKRIYSTYDIRLLDFIRYIFIKTQKMMISYNNYDKLHDEIRKILNAELNKILDFRNDYEFWFYERKFEKKFAEYCGNRYAVGTASGTAALQFALISLGIGMGDEVITVPNTYIATALSISNTGARPVFVDINPEKYTIDVSKIEDAITERTKAIMPVHLYGQICNMKEIMKLAKKYNLKIIEDCAQAHGGKFKNKIVPVTGLGCFSFHTNKILGGLGNGGIAVTDDKKLKGKIEILRDPEINDFDVRLSKRTPCYLDAIQIAFLKSRLVFLNRWIELRRKNTYLYNEMLEDSDVVIPVEEKNTKHVYYSYVIRSKRRDKLRKFLLMHGIDTRVEYSIPIHLTKTFQDLKYKKGDFPVTEKCSNEIISLPINPFLKEEEILRIAKLVKFFLTKNTSLIKSNFIVA